MAPRHRLRLRRLGGRGVRHRGREAATLAADAILLLVDEPTARLDEENARTSGTLLARAAHRRGLAVVCATHDPILIELADELVRLGPQAQLLTKPQPSARLPAVS